MLFNNMAYLPIKSARQPNIERLLLLGVWIHDSMITPHITSKRLTKHAFLKN